jgi:hypothetical protein
LRAFLRRLVILIALDLEWGLVDKRGVMKRPHGRKSTSVGFSLGGLDRDKISPWQNSDGPNFKPQLLIRGEDRRSTPVPVDMARLYAQFDFLSKIAANPLAKAKRLAFHVARTKEWIIIPPEGPRRIAGRWGTEVSASYDAMGGSIMTVSRNRAPPLPPPRNQWPMISVL